MFEAGKQGRSQTEGGCDPNDAYGGFVVSNNVLAGRPVAYSFREESPIPQLNGWTLYSVDDDQAYIEDPAHFQVVSASTVASVAPVMLEIFDAPYGTDLSWVYEEQVHTGFWDLARDRPTDIRSILRGR